MAERRNDKRNEKTEETEKTENKFNAHKAINTWHSNHIPIYIGICL